MSWRQQKHQCLCFHYWDDLTNFWRNNWRSIIDIVERLGYRVNKLVDKLKQIFGLNQAQPSGFKPGLDRITDNRTWIKSGWKQNVPKTLWGRLGPKVPNWVGVGCSSGWTICVDSGWVGLIWPNYFEGFFFCLSLWLDIN